MFPLDKPVILRQVAVATDFSECTERALQHGLAVARHFGATLHLLHLVRPSAFPYAADAMPILDEAAVRDCDRLVDSLEQAHRLNGINLRRHVMQGEIQEVVSGFVRNEKIDLLIVGTHGRSGIPRLLRGSVAQQIFHCVRCPVLVVGPRARGAGEQLQLRRILFSTDLSQESLAAVPYLLTAIRAWHAPCDVLHICSDPRGEHSRQMSDLVSTLDVLQDGEHETVAGHVLPGKPAPGVLGFSHEHGEDLIVLGLKPHRALYNGPMWSHAYEIVRHAECPVLSVRATPAESTRKGPASAHASE